MVGARFVLHCRAGGMQRCPSSSLKGEDSIGVGQGLLMGFCFASNRALKKVSFAKSTFNVPRRPVSICEEKKSLSDLSQTQDEWRMSNHRQLFSSCNQPNARESIISGVEFPIPGFYDTG